MSQPRWDLGVRLSHWTLAGSVLTCWWTGRDGIMDVHLVSGYVVLATVIFRVVWGFFGSENARWLSFPVGPRRVISYLGSLTKRVSAGSFEGHNPAGAMMVLFMLVFFGVQATLGLFTTDDIFIEGPLVALVSSSTVGDVSDWHHRLGGFVPWILAFHVFAVFFHLLWKRENLIPGMITGSHKGLSAPVTAPVSVGWALAIAGLSAAFVTGLVQWGRAQGMSW